MARSKVPTLQILKSASDSPLQSQLVTLVRILEFVFFFLFLNVKITLSDRFYLKLEALGLYPVLLQKHIAFRLKNLFSRRIVNLIPTNIIQLSMLLLADLLSKPIENIFALLVNLPIVLEVILDVSASNLYTCCPCMSTQ